jgi:NRAMP (natural resistance-associated macrophage protein)-like metal ion transporter
VRRNTRLVALLAVVGPGLLAGLSDDDPPGITTYSILGADHGYALLWVLSASTFALVVFHELGARMGIVTGQGLIGLIRQRYGVRWTGIALIALLGANLGTLCGQFAGIAAALGLADIPRGIGVPVAAVAVSTLVLLGSFRRVEHVLLALSAVFVAYVGAAFLAHPDWGAAGRGLVVPGGLDSRDAALAAVATIGTTLAPWGLAFIQSYVVDKRLRPRDIAFERVDVLLGALLTGVIGAFVVIACAATLGVSGVSIDDAGDAARALEPVAGAGAAALFGVGLVGSGLLAVSVLPLSTAYSVTDAVGSEAQLNDAYGEARLFYGAFAAIVAVAVVVVCIPGAPLIPILYLSQVLNAVLLLPLIVFMRALGRDSHLMGEHALGRAGSVATAAVIGLIAASILTTVALSLP